MAVLNLRRRPGVLATVELTATGVTLQLSSAASLPSPWVDLGDRRRWTLPASTDPQTLGELVPDQPVPYPLLVRIGTTDTDDLLNRDFTAPPRTGC